MLWVLIRGRGASNEYPQSMFSWRNKKNINTFGLKKKILLRAMHTVYTLNIGSPFKLKLLIMLQIKFKKSILLSIDMFENSGK